MVFHQGLLRQAVVRWRQLESTECALWPRHDRASELLDEWDCVDELVDEEAWSQELVV